MWAALIVWRGANRGRMSRPSGASLTVHRAAVLDRPTLEDHDVGPKAPQE
jgi:hypothetical protein